MAISTTLTSKPINREERQKAEKKTYVRESIYVEQIYSTYVFIESNEEFLKSFFTKNRQKQAESNSERVKTASKVGVLG